MDNGETGIDLTPRTNQQSATPRWIPALAVLVIALAVVGLVWFLATNSQSFLEADKAVIEREELGDKRFQLLGSPTTSAGSEQTFVIGEDEYTLFSIVFDGVHVDVVSRGTPPDLFDQGIPVVLEGNWEEGPIPVNGYFFPNGANDGWWFATDRILVKHDNDYREDRLDDAENRGQLE
jgi:cytochrome c-type biogenesis protein CcmE